MSAITLCNAPDEIPQFKPLRAGRRDIRLIQLVAPRKVDAETENVLEIACTVDVFSLDDYRVDFVEFQNHLPTACTTIEKLQKWKETRKQEYAVRYQWGDYLALSYTWGNRILDDRIIVNGTVVTVPRNLAEGLRALAKYPAVADGYIKVWNDFLCLDQENKSEIQRELKKIPAIFSHAYTVVAWIGPTMDESSLVMGVLNKFDVLNDANSDKTLMSIPISVWKALAHFLQRPYWRRMWIVQELTLGGAHTVLLCGECSTRLYFLWKLAVAITENAPRCHHLLSEALGGSYSYYDIFRHNVFSVCARLRYLYEIDGSIQEGADCDALRLLDVCRGSEQLDARDKVYGILGLLPQRVTTLIQPDLTKTAHEVYADLTRALIKATEQLDVLQNCRIDAAEPRFPTWAPDLTVKTMSHTLGPRAIMDAGGTSKTLPEFSQDGLLLTCRGALLDEIDHLTPSQWPLLEVSEEEASEALTTLTPPVQNFAYIREALWKTLVGGSAGYPHNSVAPADYAQLLDLPWPESSDDVHTMAQNFIDQNWCTTDEKQDMITFLLFRHRAKRDFDVCGYPLHSFFPSSSDHSAMSSVATSTKPQRWPKKMLRQTSMTIKKRRLFVTTDGRLGAGVTQAKRGDRIAVLSGCNTAIILRPTYGAHARMSPSFMVVGDCYVHGLMSGEAFQEGGNIQNIVLC